MEADHETVHGYYRYTDMFYEWDKLVGSEYRDAFKAALNVYTLVQPEHPLRLKDEAGLRVYIGIMHDGEQRLLMKTEQADYLRQWLYAVDLTDKLLPLPSTDMMLTERELPFITEELFDDASMFKTTQKAIERANKRLRDPGVAITTEERLAVLGQVRALWQAGVGTWCAIDFESWERDHNIVTEFGWALASVRDGQDIRDQGHCILHYGTTRTSYRNGTWVADCQDNYLYGQSQHVSRPQLKTFITKLIESAVQEGPLFLVFHDASGDMRILNDLEAPVADATKVLPDVSSKNGVYIVDTAPLYSALAGETSLTSLERVCQNLKLGPEFMHNAGNDAYFTLLALEAMATGEAVTTQRAGWV